MFIRDTLLKDLRTHVIEISFPKVNGKETMGRFTLRPDYLPPSYITEEAEERKFHTENPDFVAAWDVNSKNWTSFNIKTVTFIQDVNENY